MEISDELRERLRNASSLDEVRDLCAEPGVEMTDVVLDAFSGGDACEGVTVDLLPLCNQDEDSMFCNDRNAPISITRTMKLDIMKRRCPSDCGALDKCANVN